MVPLSIFGFRALWSPYFFAFLAAIVIIYFLITVKDRSFFKDSEPLTIRQGILFTTAMILLYGVKGSPIDLMGHLMFYAHMIQMAVLCLIIPPMIIKGIPQWIWKKLFQFKWFRIPFQFLTKPLIALFLFNGMFSFYHVPFIFDFIKMNIFIHAAYTTLLFLSALIMWWPLVNEVEFDNRLSGLRKIGYIFADGVLLTPACALIIFADTPLYATYTELSAWTKSLELCVPPSVLQTLSLSGPEMFNSMPLIHDQQLGGVLMKVIQEIAYGVVLFHVFFEWYRKEEEEAAKEQERNPFNPRTVE